MQSVNPSDVLFQSEEAYKEKVYQTLEKTYEDAKSEYDMKKDSIEESSIDDHNAFMEFNLLTKFQQKMIDAEKKYNDLYRNPYFAHLEVLLSDSNQNEHFCFSDCENLDAVLQIGDDGYLIPFMDDKRRPVIKGLRECYRQKGTKDVTYTDNSNQKQSIHPELICQDTILNRALQEVVPIFPEREMSFQNADEFLEQKLQENRSNPTFQNIIATLQRQQSEIIESDIKHSFVLQGCAGSGKSQCMIHRLFFFRNELSDNGWSKVLLLTPTQLFRNYSSELIRRYRLSSIENCSIAELYRNLLETIDSRFKARQYRFELSEEYLPDEYLDTVYQSDNIVHIENEIHGAINKYVKSGCDALGVDMPDEVTAEKVQNLVAELDQQIAVYDARESVLEQDAEYEAHKLQYEALRRKEQNAQARLHKIEIELSKNTQQSKRLNQAISNLRDANRELQEWQEQRTNRIESEKVKLFNLTEQLNKAFDLTLSYQYTKQFCRMESLIAGEIFESDERYLEFLKSYCREMEQDLQDITNGIPSTQALENYEVMAEKLTDRQTVCKAELSNLAGEIQDCELWLIERAGQIEGEESRKICHKKEMERARYFLSRLESTIFEDEVWGALAAEKERYKIQTMKIEKRNDGHQKETRILYKSDLLFYLKIYLQLKSKAQIPDYQFFCIDEGQDLHKADYDMLHSLYPKAIFNIFGDTEQVLHSACGISDWKAETNIETLYELNRNYRNTAAIVEFCNQKFDSRMKYVGQPRKEQCPVLLRNRETMRRTILYAKPTIIVKNRIIYERFCNIVGIDQDEIEYVDTNSHAPDCKKLTCYSIFAAKGLEFQSVLVYPEKMSINQKVVACTRAMEKLYYYE